MAGYFDNFTLLQNVDLTSESNVTALGGVVNGTGDSFGAAGYTPGLTSNIDFLGGNSIALSAGYRLNGFVVIKFDSQALALDQNQLFDPATASAGNPMDGNDLIQSTGNTQIAADRDLFSMSMSGAAGNTVTISRLFAGSERLQVVVTANNLDTVTLNTLGNNDLYQDIKEAWISWDMVASTKIVTVWIDGNLFSTLTITEDFDVSGFDRFHIGGASGGGIGSYPIVSVDFYDGSYFDDTIQQLTLYGASFFERGYASSSFPLGSVPRLDTTWGANIKKDQLASNDNNISIFNGGSGGWGWSETVNPADWLGDLDHINDNLFNSTWIVMSPSPNDIIENGGLVPADLEASTREALDNIFAAYPNIQGMLMLNTIPWNSPTSRDTSNNRASILTVNVMYQQIAASYPKILFFDIFTPMGGLDAPRNQNVGGALEDLIAGASGDDTNSDIDDLHLSPIGENVLSQALIQPITTLLRRESMADIVIGLAPENTDVNASALLSASGTDAGTTHTQPTGNGENYAVNVPEGYELYELGMYGESQTAVVTNYLMAVYSANATTKVPEDKITASENPVPIVANTGPDTVANIFTVDPPIAVPAGWHSVVGINQLSGPSVNIANNSSYSAAGGDGNRGVDPTPNGSLEDPFSLLNPTTIISGFLIWARLQPIVKTLTLPYPIGTNNGPMFSATSSESIAAVETAGFLDGRAGWASLLKTNDVLILQMENGTKMYTVTVDKQARTISLSTGLTIT